MSIIERILELIYKELQAGEFREEVIKGLLIHNYLECFERCIYNYTNESNLTKVYLTIFQIDKIF